MISQINRRALLSLRSRGRSEEVAVRPPWSNERSLRDLCDGCGECASACENSLITLDAGGFPRLRFDIAGCTLCGACADVCPTRAIGSVGDRAPQSAFAHVVDISHACLAFKGVACRLCEDICEPHAIRFRLLTEGRALPYVTAPACTGCGDCIGACPVTAIDIVFHEPIDGNRVAVCQEARP